MDNNFAPAVESYLPAPHFEYALSEREVDFARFAIILGDPVEALVRSGLTTEDEYAESLTDTTLRAAMYRMAAALLKSPAVVERMEHYRALHRASMDSSVERLEQELAATAFPDIANMQRPDGTPIMNLHELPRHLRAAIREFKVDKDGIVTFKLHDKLKAVQLLGDLKGHFNEANAAKAPQVTVNFGEGAPVSPHRTIDVTPTDVTPDSPPTAAPDTPDLDLGVLA